MTIATRKQKINTTKVIPLNYGEWTEYEVQGSDNGKYHVYIPAKPLSRESHYEYKTTCHCKTDPKAFPACKGNSNGTVCRHVLAAVKDRVARKNKILSLPEDGEELSAIKLLNFGGKLVKITNQSGNSKWGVVR